MIKTEEALKDAINNPSLLTISGSRLYGTDTVDSDWDYRGFSVPPFEYLLGIKNFECAELEGDHKVYSLKRFLDLTLSGDPQSVEILYCTDSQIIKCDFIGKTILSMSQDIVSMAIYNRILGYSNSEWRKASGTKLVIADRNNSEEQVIRDIRNVFHPDKEKMDDILEKLMAGKERTVVESRAGVGQKRLKQFEKFGYCVSSAAHCIRLVTQLQTLITTGEMVFPLPNAELIRDIKLGKYDFKFITELYEENVAKVRELKSKTVLPDKPNREKVWSKYTELVLSFLLKDNRFKELVSSNKEICSHG